MPTPECWGNFVPQIPYPAMRRFPRQGELVLDPFAGLGTTLLEARRLSRFAIGVELAPGAAERARGRAGRLERALRNVALLLDPGRFLALVIGDKSARGEWIPPGFRTMERALRDGFRLKSIGVKDIQENRGQRGPYRLWRRRARKGNFYIFQRECIMLFERVG